MAVLLGGAHGEDEPVVCVVLVYRDQGHAGGGRAQGVEHGSLREVVVREHHLREAVRDHEAHGEAVADPEREHAVGRDELHLLYEAVLDVALDAGKCHEEERHEREARADGDEPLLRDVVRQKAEAHRRIVRFALIGLLAHDHPLDHHRLASAHRDEAGEGEDGEKEQEQLVEAERHFAVEHLGEERDEPRRGDVQAGGHPCGVHDHRPGAVGRPDGRLPEGEGNEGERGGDERELHSEVLEVEAELLHEQRDACLGEEVGHLYCLVLAAHQRVLEARPCARVAPVHRGIAEVGDYGHVRVERDAQLGEQRGERHRASVRKRHGGER